MDDLQRAIDVLRLEGGLKNKGRAVGVAGFIDGINTAISAMQELQQYRAIGTLEECREAMELQQAKRPLLGGNPDMPDTDIFICPACSGVVGIDEERAAYCADCGQAIDWGGKEK